MHIVAIAWMFVVVLMALAEATASGGTVLGAFFTLLLYGLLPLGIVLYLLATPARKRARLRAADAAPSQASAAAGAVVASAASPAKPGPTDAADGGGETAATALAPKREKA